MQCVNRHVIRVSPYDLLFFKCTRISSCSLSSAQPIESNENMRHRNAADADDPARVIANGTDAQNVRHFFISDCFGITYLFTYRINLHFLTHDTSHLIDLTPHFNFPCKFCVFDFLFFSFNFILIFPVFINLISKRNELCDGKKKISKRVQWHDSERCTIVYLFYELLSEFYNSA